MSPHQPTGEWEMQVPHCRMMLWLQSVQWLMTSSCSTDQRCTLTRCLSTGRWQYTRRCITNSPDTACCANESIHSPSTHRKVFRLSLHVLQPSQFVVSCYVVILSRNLSTQFVLFLFSLLIQERFWHVHGEEANGRPGFQLGKRSQYQTVQRRIYKGAPKK